MKVFMIDALAIVCGLFLVVLEVRWFNRDITPRWWAFWEW